MTSKTCISLVLAIALAPAAHAAEPPRISPATDATAAGLVDIRTLSPRIEMDIRYAGGNNFTAAPVPGYEAPACYLLAPVAKALAEVEADLRTQVPHARVIYIEPDLYIEQPETAPSTDHIVIQSGN